MGEDSFFSPHLSSFWPNYLHGTSKSNGSDKKGSRGRLLGGLRERPQAEALQELGGAKLKPKRL